MRFLFTLMALIAPILSTAQIKLSRYQIQADGVHFLHVTVYDSRLLLPGNDKLDKSLFLVDEAVVEVSSNKVEESNITSEAGIAVFRTDFKSSKLIVSVSKEGYELFSSKWRLTNTMEYIDVFITKKL